VRRPEMASSDAARRTVASRALASRVQVALAINADTRRYRISVEAEDGAVTLEAGAYAVTVPAMSAPFLRLPDTPSCSGVVVSRAKLEGALAGDEDPAVALRTADGVLLVNGAPVAMTYHAGAAFTALLGRRLLLDAVKGGDGAELSLELAGPEMPIRVECGFLLALIAQRRPEALLAVPG
jgi:hypothetical protein